jgi:hypothetical protein
MGYWTAAPTSPVMAHLVAVIVGFLVVVLLNSLRVKLMWFPFHPIGYAVSSSWSMHVLWVSMFIAWVIKLLMVRYGGLRTYRAFLPLFLGFIVAECVVGGGWTILGAALHISSYRCFP